MNLRGLNKIIFAYIIEIFNVIIFSFLSFFVFSANSLESYAMVASESYRDIYDGQISFMSYDSYQLNEINEDNLLLAGTLSVRNPNENDKSYKVVLNLNNASLKDIEIFINGNILNVTLSNDGTILLDEGYLDAHSERNYDILVYTENYIDDYSFDLI